MISERGTIPKREDLVEAPVPPPPINIAKGRVAVQCHATCLQPGMDPQSVNASAGWFVDGEDPPYARPGAIAEDGWTAVDSGWVGVGWRFLVIVNHGAKRSGVNPTKEQAEAARSLILEVKLNVEDEGTITIRPGRSVMFEVARLEDVRIRCVSGQCRYTCTVFPE